MARNDFLLLLLAIVFLISLSFAHPTTLTGDPSKSILASPAPPDFELRASPSNATLPLDRIANVTIQVHAVGGFQGSVRLELTQPISSDYGPSCPDLDQPKTVTPNPTPLGHSAVPVATTWLVTLFISKGQPQHHSAA